MLWSGERIGRSSAAPPGREGRTAAETEKEAEGRSSWSWWVRLREGAAKELKAIGAREPISFTLGGESSCFRAHGWWLIHLMLGFRGVGECRRKSTSIADALLLGEVEEFRQALAIKRRVEARELSGMIGAGAAAAGWLRPFVLLPRGLAVME